MGNAKEDVDNIVDEIHGHARKMIDIVLDITIVVKN